jgi:uncharacterized Zn finger protein
VPDIVAETNNAAYSEAIKLMRKIARLMSSRGQTGDFAGYIAELRVQFRPKRNFIKLLDDVAYSKSTEK